MSTDHGIAPASHGSRTLNPNTGELTVVAALDRHSAPLLEELPHEIQVLEVRSDLAGDVDPSRMRRRHPGPLLYTLRSTRNGGECGEGRESRKARLMAAAGDYDFVDLEVDHDLDTTLLDAIEPRRRVVSWHGEVNGLAELRQCFDLMARTEAGLYRIGVHARSVAEALLPLTLLHELGRLDVTAYATGPMNTWTRVLALRLGAPVAFTWLTGQDSGHSDGVPAEADGAAPARRIARDYPLDLLKRATALYGIMSAASLAPLANNVAYEALGVPATYLRFTIADFEHSLPLLSDGLAALDLPLRGLCLGPTYKEVALDVATDATPMARRAGAACLLIRRGDSWWADSEGRGVLATLARHGVTPAGLRTAVVGCAASGRAAAAALVEGGAAAVTLVNRGRERGEQAARQLDLPFVPLTDFDPRRQQLIVHATPFTDGLLFDPHDLDPGTVILELAYRMAPTALMEAARAAGCVAIDGRQMMLTEAGRQFQLMVGHEFPTGRVEPMIAREGGTGRARGDDDRP